jgi:hypothetical protein
MTTQTAPAMSGPAGLLTPVPFSRRIAPLADTDGRK